MTSSYPPTNNYQQTHSVTYQSLKLFFCQQPTFYSQTMSSLATTVDIQATEPVAQPVAETVPAPAAEEKSPASVQWKPVQKKRKNTQQPTRRDYTKENSDPEGAVSFCLPFVHKKVSPKKVFAVFLQGFIEMIGDERVDEQFFTRLGFIERIDYTVRKDGHRTYFVHFENGRFGGNSYNRNPEAIEFLNHIKNGGKAKIFTDRIQRDDEDYRDDRRFWWVTISRLERPDDHENESASHDISDELAEE